MPKLQNRLAATLVANNVRDRGESWDFNCDLDNR
jgi:hypothetical protein